MSGKLIIFDGIEDHIIDKEFFYESDYIRSLSNVEIKEVYKYTKAYSDLIKGRNTMYSDQVSWGEFILGSMIKDIEYFKERNLKLQQTLV
jgi:hypothetical protein